MTIYQEEMQRKAQHYGCITSYDEADQLLLISHKGVHLTAINPEGFMFYNSKDLTDPESREVFSHLTDDAGTVREYVGLYESSPQMKPKDVQNYRMPGVIGWNKARLKRIIEDERYLGKEPYPTILVEETYTAMQQIKEKRNTQKDTDRKTDIFQIAVPVKCPNCGKRLIRRHDSRCKIQQRWICENKDCRLLIEVADSDLLETVSDILAGITPESIRVSEPSNNEPSIEVRQLNNDISRMLGAPQIDKDALRKKMMECIRKNSKNIFFVAHRQTVLRRTPASSAAVSP